jgi:hypothetical protein
MTISTAGWRRSVFGDIAKWWRQWAGVRAGRVELNNFDPDERDRVARDVGADSAALQALAGKWPERTDLLSRRIEALKLDADEIARLHPPVANDLKKLCWMCASKRRCERDLATDPDNPIWREYCPNATTLTALQAERGVRSKSEQG